MAVDEIVIAGAGPGGLVAALALAQAGIPSTVLEAAPTLPRDLRATTFHPPTLDMLDAMGITPRLIELGSASPRWQFRDRSLGRVAEFDLELIADVTRHPYRLQCEQFYLTAVLLDALQALGLTQIRFATEVVGLTQDDDGIDIAWRGADGKGSLRAPFLIGADGGRSAIRHLLPVSFDGFTYTERLLQVGTPFAFRDHLPDIADINYISDPEEWCVLLRVADYWRVSFPLGPDEDEAEALTDAALQARLQRLLPKPGDYAIEHRKCWRIHQRVASDFRHGRVLLLGDAAHINSPHGGMGMNSAIHDAINLAGRIGPLWRDGGAIESLDRYTRQRRFVALEDVRVQSMRNSQLMSERDPAIRGGRLEQMRAMAEDTAAARRFLLDSSMISGLEKAAAIA